MLKKLFNSERKFNLNRTLKQLDKGFREYCLNKEGENQFSIKISKEVFEQYCGPRVGSNRKLTAYSNRGTYTMGRSNVYGYIVEHISDTGEISMFQLNTLTK